MSISHDTAAATVGALYIIGDPQKLLRSEIDVLAAYVAQQRAAPPATADDVETADRVTLEHQRIIGCCQIGPEILRDLIKQALSAARAQGRAEQDDKVRVLREALCYLTDLVIGECPRLLDEDSGGDSALAVRIDAALERTKP